MRRLPARDRLYLVLSREERRLGNLKYLRRLGMRWDSTRKQWFVRWPCRDYRLLRLADPAYVGVIVPTGQGAASTRPTGCMASLPGDAA